MLGGLASVSQKTPCDWKLILIGRDDGNQVDLEQQSNNLGLKDNIIFEGEKTNITDYLSISDIGVSPRIRRDFQIVFSRGWLLVLQWWLQMLVEILKL